MSVPNHSQSQKQQEAWAGGRDSSCGGSPLVCQEGLLDCSKTELKEFMKTSSADGWQIWPQTPLQD